MTPAVLLAGCAGLLATVAVADLVHAARRRRRRATGRWMLALVGLGRRLGVLRPPGDLDARLDAAGRPLRLSAADAMAAKAGAAAVALLAGFSLAAAAPGRLGIVLVAVAPVAGFLGPDLWLRRRARARAEAMDRELADVLDLLRVAVEAGLPTGRALGEVGRRHAGLLGGELARAAREVDLGVHRDDALAALVRRAPLPAVASLVAATDRSERHGAPLAPALHSLAAEARADRARALAERAGRAAPKIQLVVALLLVPAVMLVVGASLVSALT